MIKNEQYEFVKSLILSQSNKRKTKMLSSCFLNFFIPKIFSMFPDVSLLNLKYCSIVREALINIEPAVAYISHQTFYNWFKKVIEEKLEIKSNLDKSK